MGKEVIRTSLKTGEKAKKIVEILPLPLGSDLCENNVIYCTKSPSEAVEILLATPPFPVEKGRKKRKVYLPPPHKGKVPLHKEWWRTSSEGLRDPCQPACSNRAKCWSRTLETEQVRRQGRYELFGDRKFPRPQDDSKLRQRVNHTTLGKCGTGRAAT